ncbi:MAG: FAD-dependent oxidoreductase [Nocardioidaceae bacterium]
MTRVIVVGAGVVGLTCAVRLLERGHRVDVVARDLPLETTSAVAAALWYPYRALPADRVTGWARRTYAALEALATEESTGVRMLPGTEVQRGRVSEPWWRAAVPSLSRADRVAPPYAGGWTFVAPVAEMPVYLRWLVDRVERLGGTLTRLALGALPDHGGVVVDAAGLGARRLAGDLTLTPVRGQVVHVDHVEVDRWWLEGSSAGAAPVYVVPRRRDVVVGGTDDEGAWDRRPDPDVARAILARAAVLVPALTEARVVGHRVGLRPARPAVRLEEERRGRTRVIHCYGHGGAGVTLSWGCADEVADLVGDPG